MPSARVEGSVDADPPASAGSPTLSCPERSAAPERRCPAAALSAARSARIPTSDAPCRPRCPRSSPIGVPLARHPTRRSERRFRGPPAVGEVSARCQGPLPLRPRQGAQLPRTRRDPLSRPHHRPGRLPSTDAPPPPARAAVGGTRHRSSPRCRGRAGFRRLFVLSGQSLEGLDAPVSPELSAPDGRVGRRLSTSAIITVLEHNHGIDGIPLTPHQGLLPCGAWT